MLIGSPHGGMDIEAVAEKSPDSIIKQYVDIDAGKYGMVMFNESKNTSSLHQFVLLRKLSWRLHGRRGLNFYQWR